MRRTRLEGLLLFMVLHHSLQQKVIRSSEV
jgi:hypothetical protein